MKNTTRKMKVSLHEWGSNRGSERVECFVYRMQLTAGSAIKCGCCNKDVHAEFPSGSFGEFLKMFDYCAFKATVLMFAVIYYKHRPETGSGGKFRNFL